jgi:hypothetical protein
VISYEEAGRLLGLAAARDQRTVGDADVLAWHADLNAANVTFSDASAALTRFYAVDMASLEPDRRRRVTTPDVISIARKIRSERLANFIYEPPPGDSDPDYLKRLRGQIASAADGNSPAPVGRQALEGEPHPKVKALLSGIGRSVPGDDEGIQPEPAPAVKRPGPLGVECPTCKAAIGRACKTAPLGDDRRRPKELRKPHAARARVANGGPAELEGSEEIEARRKASLARLAELAATEQPSIDEAEAS